MNFGWQRFTQVKWDTKVRRRRSNEAGKRYVDHFGGITLLVKWPSSSSSSNFATWFIFRSLSLSLSIPFQFLSGVLCAPNRSLANQLANIGECRMDFYRFLIESCDRKIQHEMTISNISRSKEFWALCVFWKMLFRCDTNPFHQFVWCLSVRISELTFACLTNTQSRFCAHFSFRYYLLMESLSPAVINIHRNEMQASWTAVAKRKWMRLNSFKH